MKCQEYQNRLQLNVEKNDSQSRQTKGFNVHVIHIEIAIIKFVHFYLYNGYIPRFEFFN